MKIIRLIPTMFVAAAVAVSMSSCEDMMDLKSESYLYDEDNRLDSANDSLYSAMGILTQMQKLGERYVLLGELRGDLMTVTGEASVSLQEISNFAMTADNTFGSRRDYYSVINNCNYAIERMDTTVTEHNSRVMVPEYTAIRTMRAWTYLQMGLTYGRVQWIDKPILSLEESELDYPVVELGALVTKLIADIEPLAANSVPNYGSVDGLMSNQFFMEPRLLLGDLYLMSNRYADAARMYYDYIRIHNVTLPSLYANTWETNQANSVGMEAFMQSISGEIVTMLPYPSDARKDRPNLLNLTYSAEPQIVAADWWINDLAQATHFHVNGEGATSISGFLSGDLRGEWFYADGTTAPVSIGDVALSGNAGSADGLITKFFGIAEAANVTNTENPLVSGYILRMVPLYRNSHVYLRYAEAVNRMGKPTLAFAVLKHGLRPDVVADPTKVDPSELEDQLAFTNFASTSFDNNRGSAMRGRGLGINLSQSTYQIPEFDTPEETMEWVEDEIVREMAAETMFEGNRFFDLMRVSNHRGGTEYFAEMVSRRFENRDAAKALLQNRENWWLK